MRNFQGVFETRMQSFNNGCTFNSLPAFGDFDKELVMLNVTLVGSVTKQHLSSKCKTFIELPDLVDNFYIRL